MFPYCESTLANVGIVVIGSAHPKTGQSIGSVLARGSFDKGECQSVGLNIWRVVKRYVIDWKRSVLTFIQKWPFIPW
jgi:hypothetical protein